MKVGGGGGIVSSEDKAFLCNALFKAPVCYSLHKERKKLGSLILCLYFTFLSGFGHLSKLFHVLKGVF